MVDMIPTNMKLKKRAQHIVVETTGVAGEGLGVPRGRQWNIKAAIVMAQANCTIERALDLLDKGEGVVAGRWNLLVSDSPERMGREHTANTLLHIRGSCRHFALQNSELPTKSWKSPTGGAYDHQRAGAPRSGERCYR